MATIKSYTSLEQSKKLLELGLSPETADMYYSNEAEFIGKIEYTEYPYLLLDDDKLSKTDLPCWSVGALLEMLPEEIKYQGEWCSLEFAKDWISYEGCDKYDASCRIQPFAFNKKPFIELLFDSMVWLLERNYIKKGE